MKGLQILASLLLIAAFCKADDETMDRSKQMEAAIEECATEVGLSKDEAEKAADKICTGEEMDKKFSCHTACFYKKLGGMEGGEILPDGIKATILSNMKSDEVRTELEGKLDGCKTQSDSVSDECDKAVAFTKCMFGDTEFCKKRT